MLQIVLIEPLCNVIRIFFFFFAETERFNSAEIAVRTYILQMAVNTPLGITLI